MQTATTTSPEASKMWRKVPVFGGLISAAGLLYLALFARADEQLPYSLLVALAYWVSISLGAMFFVLIHHAAKAGWSVTLRRIAENLMVPLPLIVVLGVGILTFALKSDVYHWATDHALHDPILQAKAAYLNGPFFVGRLLLYLVVWTVLVWLFRSRSVAQDTTGDPALSHKMRAWSYPAVVLFALTTAFSGMDWLMTLDPHWFSTMFGVYFFSGSVVGGFAAIALLAVLLRPVVGTDVITVEHLHDIGKLLFGFTVFWTYIAFSQYFLIWYANLPEETLWYQHRWVGSWRTWSVFLVFGHFVVPFYFLMSRHIKRNPKTLAMGAVWMLAMHFVDLFWLVMPTLQQEGGHLTATDLASWMALGGVFLAVFGVALNRAAFIPVRDPRLAESLAFENF